MTNKDRALMVAEKHHHNQSYDIYPYIYHVRMVARVAEKLGYDEVIVIACILHDILEDASLSYGDIKKAFGTEVAEIVYCVTDELGRNRHERKEKTYPKIKSNWKAVVVKICDRVANVTHSREYTPKLFEMYKKEHADFCAALDSSAHPTEEMNRAWAELKKVME